MLPPITTVVAETCPPSIDWLAFPAEDLQWCLAGKHAMEVQESCFAAVTVAASGSMKEDLC